MPALLPCFPAEMGTSAAKVNSHWVTFGHDVLSQQKSSLRILGRVLKCWYVVLAGLELTE